MGEDYKTSKEAFVSGMTGSSVGHVNMISLVALASIALYAALRTRLPASTTISFPIELLILVLPLLLSITLFAHKPLWLSLFLLIPTGLLILLPRRHTDAPLLSSVNRSRPQSPNPSKVDGVKPESKEDASTDVVIAPLPALTTYRSHMLLMTFLAILAVDFPVFPRSLAKCETFGVSMMDLGVGSFVFSQGVVSAIPLIKNAAYLRDPLIPKMFSVFRKCMPLFALGVIRTLSVKSVEYPEHQTEYGVHWNFFITLGFIQLLEICFHPLMARLPVSMLGILVVLAQQVALGSGLTDFVLTAPRTNIWSANKEGLVSLPGYLAVHLLGVSVGTLILPPSPSYFRRRQQQLAHVYTSRTHADSDSDSDTDAASTSRQKSHVSAREDDKTAIELCSYAVMWWFLFYVMHMLGVGGDVSRRLVNLQYVLWVAAYNTSFLLGYLLLDLHFFASPLSRSVYSPTSHLKVRPDASADMTRPAAHAPALLEALNRNGLALFLLANLATGVVNLAVPTMYVADWAAMLVLSLYATGICAVAWVFRGRRLWRF